jgi:hypothetical protein
MEILEAFDLTRCAHSAAELAGVDEKTVAQYVAIRDTGRDPLGRVRRVRAIDPFLGKIEELVDKSRAASAPMHLGAALLRQFELTRDQRRSRRPCRPAGPPWPPSQPTIPTTPGS